jgi:hypothetical protein
METGLVLPKISRGPVLRDKGWREGVRHGQQRCFDGSRPHGCAKREVAGDWDEESITEGRESFLIYLGIWYQVENNRMT